MLDYLQRIEILIELERQRKLAAKLKAQEKRARYQRNSQNTTGAGK